MQEARSLGIKVRGYLSTVIACPFDGPTRLKRVAAPWPSGCWIWAATRYPRRHHRRRHPGTVAPMLDAVLHEIPAGRLAVHFHDTYGQGWPTCCRRSSAASAPSTARWPGSAAALCPRRLRQCGVEEVVYLLHGLGMSTGVDLDQLAATGQWVSELLGRPNGSRVGQALHGRDGASHKSASSAPREAIMHHEPGPCRWARTPPAHQEGAP